MRLLRIDEQQKEEEAEQALQVRCKDTAIVSAGASALCLNGACCEHSCESAGEEAKAARSG